MLTLDNHTLSKISVDIMECFEEVLALSSHNIIISGDEACAINEGIREILSIRLQIKTNPQ